MRLLPLPVFAVAAALTTTAPAAIQPPKEGTTESTAVPAGKAGQPDPNDRRPLGVWVRETPEKITVTVALKVDRFQINYGDKKGQNYFFLEGDYGVTKDYVLFGVVNSADGTFPSGEFPIDKPFRFRVDDDALTIKEMNLPYCSNTASRIEGRYTLQKK